MWRQDGRDARKEVFAYLLSATYSFASVFAPSRLRGSLFPNLRIPAIIRLISMRPILYSTTLRGEAMGSRRRSASHLANLFFEWAVSALSGDRRVPSSRSDGVCLSCRRGRESRCDPPLGPAALTGRLRSRKTIETGEGEDYAEHREAFKQANGTKTCIFSNSSTRGPTDAFRRGPLGGHCGDTNFTTSTSGTLSQTVTS